ncbi:MAG: hypothetical protein V3S89_06030, partial [Desulfobacterales bacterium]
SSPAGSGKQSEVPPKAEVESCRAYQRKARGQAVTANPFFVLRGDLSHSCPTFARADVHPPRTIYRSYWAGKLFSHLGNCDSFRKQR